MFPVEKMCKVLKVSKSGYYKWLSSVPGKRSIRRAGLLKEIVKVYELSERRYGSPRITEELNAKGIKVSEVLVAKIMRKNNIKSIVRKKYRITTDSSHCYPIVENVLDRNFSVCEPNRAWVSDLTYIHTGEGWLYLTTVIDLFDRKVIGWALSNTMRAKQTSIAAFKMACINRPVNPNDKLIFHSDRGIQYACDEFTYFLNGYTNIIQSMSRKGNCWDNAVAESFFKTIKTELIYHHQYTTRQYAKLSIFDYIERFYNQRRRHLHLGNLTITEFSKSFNNNQKIAA